MKKIVFLIIATLLVMGLVLPGCGGNGNGADPRPAITIAVCGPMGQTQGKHHWWGAEMARNEINGSDSAVDGVTVGTTLYRIALKKVETNEVLVPNGSDGYTALSAVIDDVDFVVGGFRTEAVFNYRDVAMDAKKIFINCGASTEALQNSVVTDYTGFKYFFKATPPNEIFLTKSNEKVLGMILGAVASYNDTWTPTVAIIAENAQWTELSRMGALAKFTGYGWMCGGDGLWLPNPVATTGEMNVILDEMDQADPRPNIIFVLMSGPVGVTYANLVGDFLPNVLNMGINVEAMRDDFPSAAKYAENMIFLDSWAPGVNITAQTDAFTSAYETYTGEWPIYTAATYEAIHSLVENIETADSLVTDTLIPVMEASTREGTSGKNAYYPVWDGSTTGDFPPYSDLPALTQPQVLALYPWLTSAKYAPYPPTVINNWTYDEDDWTMMPHTSHDLVYGSEWLTGTCSQWQDVGGGNLEKIGVWPKAYLPGVPTDLTTFLGALGVDAFTPVELYTFQKLGLWDQYGWWHIEYDGTGTVELTDWITWLASDWDNTW